ncbi:MULTISPECIES: hypothetical protein [unclassified Sphingomonas]|jgi:hypothetical protein|uniref:hypothetical protein n=1 Tax=unclassified Sphingomonas TaxID=196159 RepID=UPI00226A6F55|nr:MULTISPECIES: hypothetical protein [unclassified Sphingomonas]
MLDPALARALADELVDLTHLLSELAYDLAAHPETLRRHMHSLQAVDRVTQTQLAVAELLRATGPIERRLAAVTLEDMAVRLNDRLARYSAEDAAA